MSSTTARDGTDRPASSPRHTRRTEMTERRSGATSKEVTTRCS